MLSVVCVVRECELSKPIKVIILLVPRIWVAFLSPSSRGGTHFSLGKDGSVFPVVNSRVLMGTVVESFDSM